MKTLKIMLVGMLLLGTVSVYALFNQSKGEAAMTSMSLPVDAKSLSLGYANSVVLDDASAIFNNPASINMDQKISIIANTNLWLKDSFHQFVGYTQKLDGIGVVGLGINYFSYGELFYVPEGYTVDAESKMDITEKFTASDLGVSLLYSGQLNPKMSYGVTLNYYGQNIGAMPNDFNTKYSSIGISLNAGIKMNEIIPDLNLAASLKNLGIMTSGDKLDYTLQVGTEYLLLKGKNLSVLTDVKVPLSSMPSIHVGVNYAINRMFEIRCGYRTDQLDLGTIAGITAGFGLNIMNYKLDIAYQPNPIEGLGAAGPGSIWITIGGRIGNTPKDEVKTINVETIQEIEKEENGDVETAPAVTENESSEKPNVSPGEEGSQSVPETQTKNIQEESPTETIE